MRIVRGFFDTDRSDSEKRTGTMKLRTVLIAIGLMSVALSVEAQVLTGNIIGVVRDESRAILPGVTVTVSSPALPGGPATTVTNPKASTGSPVFRPVSTNSRSRWPASRPIRRPIYGPAPAEQSSDLSR